MWRRPVGRMPLTMMGRCSGIELYVAMERVSCWRRPNTKMTGG